MSDRSHAERARAVANYLNTLARNRPVPLVTAALHDAAAVADYLERQPDAWAASIAERLRTQDNRITANPIFAVQQRVRTYGFGDDFAERFEWVYAEGGTVDDEQATQLEAMYRRGEKTDSNVLRLGYVDTWEFVTACLTEQGCNDYIAINGHNLTDPRVYVYGGFRNAEWEQLRSYFLGSVPASPVPRITLDVECPNCQAKLSVAADGDSSCVVASAPVPLSQPSDHGLLRLAAASLVSEVLGQLDMMRECVGNTNVAVLKHHAEVTRGLLAADTREPQPSTEQS